MQIKEAKVFTFHIKEAVDILLAAAKKNGADVPPAIETMRLEVDGQQSLVHCTVVFPTGVKGMTPVGSA